MDFVVEKVFSRKKDDDSKNSLDFSSGSSSMTHPRTYFKLIWSVLTCLPTWWTLANPKQTLGNLASNTSYVQILRCIQLSVLFSYRNVFPAFLTWLAWSPGAWPIPSQVVTNYIHHI